MSSHRLLDWSPTYFELAGARAALFQRNSPRRAKGKDPVLPSAPPVSIEGRKRMRQGLPPKGDFMPETSQHPFTPVLSPTYTEADADYEILHDETLARLGLVPNAQGWTHDLLSAAHFSSRSYQPEKRDRWMATAASLLEGQVSLQPSFDGVLWTLLGVRDGLRPTEWDNILQLLFITLIVLDLRWMEAERAGDLLQPNARALRSTLERMLLGLLTPSAYPQTNALSVKTPTREQVAVAESPIEPGLTQVSRLAIQRVCDPPYC